MDIAKTPWSRGARVGFRFLFAYLVLYNLPFPLGQEVTATEWLGEAYEKGWNKVVIFLGKHVLHLSHEIAVEQTGSGDRTADFVLLGCYFVLATVTTIVWSLLDNKRAEYTKLHAGLRIYIRYALAATMISYGMFKVIKSQFPFPGPGRLVEPYGESSPMGLLWTFMGYSVPYNVFAGTSEILGGVLLFSRRTTTLGALVSAAVMSNVVMLNFSYDVPVKQYSSHLLLMAVFLAAPDLRRVFDFFVLHRATRLVTLPRSMLRAPWVERARVGLKAVFITTSCFASAKMSYEGWQTRGEGAPKVALEGLYEVESFTREGEDVPPLLTDTTRWRRMWIRGENLVVQRMNDKKERFGCKDDAEKHTVTLTSSNTGDDGAEPAKIVMRYTRPDDSHLTLDGTLEKDVLTVRLRKVDDSSRPLINRGFHWINEAPFNR